MTIVAHARPFVVGVDNHARDHALAILVAATGELLASEPFPATNAGVDRADQRSLPVEVAQLGRAGVRASVDRPELRHDAGVRCSASPPRGIVGAVECPDRLVVVAGFRRVGARH